MISPPPFFICCLLLVFLPLSILLSANTNSIRIPLQLHPIFPRFKTATGSSSVLPVYLGTVENTPRVVIRRRFNGDGALLRRAARCKPNPISPGKVAFMFLTTVPLPFAPLWERFFANRTGLFNIYVHADPTRPYPVPFEGVFSGRVIPSSKPTRRAHHSLIAAARRLLAHALLDDPGNAVFVLLSPSCIPLRSFPFVHRALIGRGGGGKSFIEILAGEPGIEERYNARGEGTMMPEVPFERFRVGSQFFSLRRRHAVAVANDTALWSKFRRPCRDADSCYPEEHYFATLLSMRDPRGCVPATLTHVDWTGSVGGHPRTYAPEEVGPDLIRGLRSARPRYGEDAVWGEAMDKRWDPFLFARKFAPECLVPLMRIADEVILLHDRR
ncbi:hypothetical protein H6P81_000288 [Aristolochia fimbriata]|uniref:Core-2/I-branching beta-1,6-N-acetylglucosaminyltransferase family protein n=1 Tax=Aristolochia fimbriata TaxID=158543 RepID=A0AAV7F3P1_ARIFI|nr:hypothetical protein H6P81_000288 [Aristolochia fimbriata]